MKAYYAESAFSGLGILDVVYDTTDCVLLVYMVDGQKHGRIHRNKIYYGERPYIKVFGRRYYLDMFL